MDVLTDLSARGSRLRRIPLFATLPFKLAALRRFRFNHPSRQHGYEHAYTQITAMRRPSHIVPVNSYLTSDRANSPRIAVLGKHTRYAQTTP